MFCSSLLENVNAMYQRAQASEELPFVQNYIPKHCLGFITCMSALSRSQLCFCQNLRQYFNVGNNIQCFPKEYLFHQTLANEPALNGLQITAVMFLVLKNVTHLNYIFF